MSLSSCRLHFLVSPNLSITFFSFLELSLLSIYFRSTVTFSNLIIRSSRICSFSESSSHPRPMPVTSCLVFDLYFFLRLIKWSLTLHVKTANVSQLFKLSAIFRQVVPLFKLPYLLSNILLFAIPFTIRMSFSLFHNLKKGGNRKLVYMSFKTWRWKARPRLKKSSVK